jgi:hypothetical protein
MNAIDLAYLAGVIDSDGSITINIAREAARRNVKCSPTYQEVICCGQVQTEAVYLLQALFGGSISVTPPRAVGRKPLYGWDARCKLAVIAIRALLPFLRIKRRQAEIVLQLRAIKDRGRTANSELIDGHRYLTAATLSEMEALTREVRSLNDTRYPIKG